MEARKRKLGTSNEFKFELNFIDNLNQLYEDILNRTYRPSRGIAFVNRSPVIREIFAAPFRDRVVHHLIIKHVEPWWDRRFIYDSYSCRKGKGTDFGIRRLYSMMRRVSDNFHKPTVVLKYDLQGYFTSLPHDGLYERVDWGLKKQFLGEGHTTYDEELYDMLAFLWWQVIFDKPTVDVTVKGDKKLWQQLPQRKSLFCQPDTVGIVIGNLTSQVASNIYLDQLDRFVTITLGIKNYGRYVDDFFVVLPAGEVGKFRREVEPIIENFITGMRLTLHPKKRQAYRLEQGVPFLGAKLYPYHVYPDERIIKHYRKDLRLVMNGRKDVDTIVSYMGRLQHFDAARLQQKLWAEVGLEYRIGRRSCPNSKYFTDPKVYKQSRRPDGQYAGLIRGKCWEQGTTTNY